MGRAFEVVSALYGPTLLTINSDNDSATASFPGNGAAVVGGVQGYERACNLTGTWAMHHSGYDESAAAVVLDAAFIHSPYATRPLPSDTFAPLPEMQLQGPALGWVREQGQRLLLPV